MLGAFHEKPLASEIQAVDDRLLQSMLGQGHQANDVPTDGRMVFSVATRVWVDHAEAQQEVQGAQISYGSTLGDRLTQRRAGSRRVFGGAWV